MNPIMEATLAHIGAGKEIVRITVDKPYKPSKVIFEFSDGANVDLALECDHDDFMSWWKHSSRCIRLMRLIQPLDEVDA